MTDMDWGLFREIQINLSKMRRSVHVVLWEPYHNNSEVLGVFSTHERAIDYLATKGEPVEEGNGFWSLKGHAGSDDYYSVTEIQVDGLVDD